MSTEYPFGEFLADSFALLRREVAPIHAELCRRLAPATVRLTVDRDVAGVQFESNATRMLSEVEAPTIEVHTTREVILDLVGARTTLMEAILNDRLSLRGTVDGLQAFHEGLMAYLHGAFRAPSFLQILRAFRADAQRRATTDQLRRLHGEANGEGEGAIEKSAGQEEDGSPRGRDRPRPTG